MPRRCSGDGGAPAAVFGAVLMLPGAALTAQFDVAGAVGRR